MTAGLHVPGMPLPDVAGNAGAALFWQSGPICVNVGTVCAFTVMISDALIAHCPLLGVNV